MNVNELQQESGQKALRAAGLHDKFLKLCRPEGGDLRILDKKAAVHFELIEEGNMYNPEIDRAELRQLLLDSISPDTIKWNHKVVNISENGASYTLEFADASQEKVTVDIVVGADGAWSRVRAMSTIPATPVYSGITFVDLTLSAYESEYPALSKFVGRGSLLALEDGKGILAQRNSRDVIRVYAALQVDEQWQHESNIANAPDVASRVELLTSKENYFADWDNELQNLIRAATCNPNLPAIIRPIYALPLSYLRDPLKNDTHIVLLGDAAHLMSPFAGEGVNLAMADALDLANALASITASSSWSRVGISAALRKYEIRMRARAFQAATESATNLDTFFGENAAIKVKELFLNHMPPKIVMAGIKLVRRLFAGFW